MAGSITISSITLDSDNNFSIKSNTGATLFSANNTGIISGVQNTAISGVISGTQLAANSVNSTIIAANTISNTNIQTGTIEAYMRAQGATSVFAGMRNRIINGAMMIDQRNAGANTTPGANIYTLDRWQNNTSGSGVFSVQQDSSANTVAGFSSSLKVTSLAATTVNSGDNYCIRQQVEGYNWSDLAWGSASAKAVTLSFWVRSSVTGTFGGALENAATTRSYPFTYTISSSNTWEQKILTIPGDTSGTWSTDNGTGVRLWFSIGTGSTYNGTAGAWAGSDYRSATGATQLVNTAGATWYITGVQLEAGSTPTPFEYRQYGAELNLCQRYYENFGINQRQFWTTSGQMTTKPYSYKATKRTSPTVTISNTYTTDGWTSYGVESHNNPSGVYDPTNIVGISVTSSGSQNTIAIVACRVTSDAEL